MFNNSTKQIICHPNIQCAAWTGHDIHIVLMLSVPSLNHKEHLAGEKGIPPLRSPFGRGRFGRNDKVILILQSFPEVID